MKKTILVTGSNGFIAKNLLCHLKYNQLFNAYKVLEACRTTTDEKLKDYVESSDIVIHLAGENRPKLKTGFVEGNYNYTQKIIEFSRKHRTPIIYTSSTQAELKNDYGMSKLAAEKSLLSYQKETGAVVAISRLANVFGKWCKPNYNSFVATMCHNIWRNLPITIDDEQKVLSLVYVDDVVKTILDITQDIFSAANFNQNYFEITPSYEVSIGNIYKFFKDIKYGQENLKTLERSDGLSRALSATFLSYCPEDKIKYPLQEHKDQRGSFYEVFKLGSSGQVSVSTTKPGVVRGNHFHHSKQEKFLVVKGKCLFKFRNVISGELIELETSELRKEVVEVPLGFTHNFSNIGDSELVVLIWCNEEFDNENPDTFFLEV